MKKLILTGLISLSLMQSASATEWINVSNVGDLHWQLYANDSKVWLRNLHQFDTQALGCCYNYHIDLSTETGRAIWAVFLMKYASKQPLILGVAQKSQLGHISALGNW